MATCYRASLRQLFTTTRTSLSTTKQSVFKPSLSSLFQPYTKRHKHRAVVASGRVRITLVPLLSRRPQLTTIRAMSTAYSACWEIKRDLEALKHEKWGWVIYRTGYKDDLAWFKFKHLLSQWTAHNVSNSDEPGILNNVEWVFMDDRATFDRASREFLRQHFKQWAEASVVTENPRAGEVGLDRRTSTRYCEFVQVDDDCLRGITDGVDETWDISIGLPGCVYFIDGDWKPSRSESDEEEEEFEGIDGCKEENVGWMLVPTSHLAPEFYTNIADSWWTFYVRPPQVLEW